MRGGRGARVRGSRRGSGRGRAGPAAARTRPGRSLAAGDGLAARWVRGRGRAPAGAASCPGAAATGGCAAAKSRGTAGDRRVGWRAGTAPCGPAALDRARRRARAATGMPGRGDRGRPGRSGQAATAMAVAARGRRHDHGGRGRGSAARSSRRERRPALSAGAARVTHPAVVRRPCMPARAAALVSARRGQPDLRWLAGLLPPQIAGLVSAPTA